MNLTELKIDFRKRGYCVVPEAISESELSDFHNAVDVRLNETPEDGGGRFHVIGRGEERRFLRHRHEDFPAIEHFLFSEKIRELVLPLIGPSAYLFNEQFVVKGANTGASFAWHQDSAYVGFDHTPYLTIWIALDDTTENNGCLYVLPRDLNQNSIIDPHHWDDEGKELVGYDGVNPGIAIECASGSMVVFSSLTLHRSGGNSTGARRRAYSANIRRSRPAHAPKATNSAARSTVPSQSSISIL